MIGREKVELFEPTTTKNQSGGKSVVDLKGNFLMCALCEVKELKPTREQVAEAEKLGKTIEVKMWARKDVVLKADHILFWKDVPYRIIGPPVNTKSIPIIWLLYAKTLSA